jgi:hypothetical protein
MDDATLEKLTELICGDDPSFAPVYRTGGELTRFFARANVARLQHDGSTRKWWTLDAIRSCNGYELESVILRLANPKEYAGDREKVIKALESLNKILQLEARV